MVKPGLRKELKQRLQDQSEMISGERGELRAREIFARIEALDTFAAARTVALYCALPGEVPTGGAIERWSRTKTVVLPRIGVPDGSPCGEMDFCLHDPARGLVCGAYGIQEPCGEVCAPRQIDLIVVPGLGFDAAGHRLGRGKGYYDKYLGGAPGSLYKVGVCWDFQLVDQIPVEGHDAVMDAVVTEKRQIILR